MINTNKLDKISYTNKVLQMYQELNTSIVRDILSKVKSTGDLNSVTRYQLKVIARQGGKEIFKQALKKTNKLSITRKKELYNLFEQVMEQDIKDYKDLYKYRNKEVQLTNKQLDLIEQMSKLTNNELKNFTKTIAFSSQKEYVNAIDMMYKQVVSGGIDINTAFKNTSHSLAEKGITLKTKNGNRSIESAVRQNVLYGIRRTAQNVEDELIDYLGADGVQINITPNCRHEHIPINGKIFSLDKKNKKYPYFKSDYKDLLNDFGCQHYTSPFIIGVSEPVYSDYEIKRADSRVVKYKGEQLPIYDATQKQRALERGVRNAKKTYMSSPTEENKTKVGLAQKKVRQFTKETGLQRDYDREFYAGYN